jgi:hypothetical protein
MIKKKFKRVLAFNVKCELTFVIHLEFASKAGSLSNFFF